MSNLSSLLQAGVEQVRKSWGWFLVFGAALMALGALCLGKAQTATKFSILALGWVLAISGVLWLVSSFWAFSWHGFLVFLLNGLIRFVTGYLLLRHPDAGAAGVTILLASLFIVAGVFRTAAASAIRFPQWGWMAFSGLVSLALGVYLLATWPEASAYFIGMAIGIDLIFDGAALLRFAGAIRTLPQTQTGTR
jgi:uncharacterized membrane protein HdeD (DUF308 family)